MTMPFVATHESVCGHITSIPGLIGMAAIEG
jgi:hypothetical protein